MWVLISFRDSQHLATFVATDRNATSPGHHAPGIFFGSSWTTRSVQCCGVLSIYCAFCIVRHGALDSQDGVTSPPRRRHAQCVIDNVVHKLCSIASVQDSIASYRSDRTQIMQQAEAFSCEALVITFELFVLVVRQEFSTGASWWQCRDREARYSFACSWYCFADSCKQCS